ncbi:MULTISPECIES: PAS domain-containing protein [unclassified Caballeronia]|uniref:PAS domain-containing protein n=1 Tax=unclassified Caballeronia TaxID=2646786 RepID=UPI0020284FF4
MIRDDGGRCFLRKIFPYLSETGVIVGVAITFADITDRTHADVASLRHKKNLSEE